MPLRTGDFIGAYEIVAPLGQGGMATVYKAHHARLNRFVAIKMIHPAYLQDESYLARFQREAQIVAALDHPHIVPIYDFSEHEGEPYLVMKLIEGSRCWRTTIPARRRGCASAPTN
jgi:serine/threonine-protein kinase